MPNKGQTQSQHSIIIASPTQQWLCECASLLRYKHIAFLVKLCGQSLSHDRFTTVETAPCTHWKWGRVGPKASLKALEKGTSLAPARQTTSTVHSSSPHPNHYTDWAIQQWDIVVNVRYMFHDRPVTADPSIRKKLKAK